MAVGSRVSGFRTPSLTLEADDSTATRRRLNGTASKSGQFSWLVVTGLRCRNYKSSSVSGEQRRRCYSVNLVFVFYLV